MVSRPCLTTRRIHKELSKMTKLPRLISKKLNQLQTACQLQDENRAVNHSIQTTSLRCISIFTFTEDLYQSEAFTRSTNRDGSSTWRVTEITLRLKDKYYLVKHVYSPENGDDVIFDDELHRYLQC
ncbi:hypothetical protein HOLleu_23927 [Holothuria leucospilota]|uniref:Uncharacterized protein n=1 Tax=Holothuria leucospilota TaxID=206669 RepID=A0A9Q1BVQ5_HOLLE|nr:hypothetical protein HOLleu_23927 [Holothuria leucospilota]